ncbi:translation initiation factor 4E [Tupanvirus soda lake]|uniref:Translation initiation factor 4E n=2 Tax=Tupanvirus TaxID=2094720 RepID=A0A6N1NM11_9VIRU|nr:translation initiation factor 4E [Tupanvirus soda lake]QKU35485.1 translation initiation factor 4E [Tupanvirus soda lake]
MDETPATTNNDTNEQNNLISQGKLPADIPLTDINLPNQWVLYLYDKTLYKKMANRPNFQAKPHKELCTITTVNDLMYILQLMEVKTEPKLKIDFMNSNKINLDANDYIIMRKGIEPIWEDPKNSNGGTFTIKMNHSKGYDVWATFMMYMLGETLSYDMQNINGITVSYISDAYNFNNNNSTSNNSYTYIKIWDAKPNRTRDEFVNILPIDLYNRIKDESLLYTSNNKKKDYGQEDIISKLTNNRKNSYNGGRDRGGFTNYRRR